MQNLCNLYDAAEYIIYRFGGSISTMKLQKLLYFSQGWCLALLNRRLVDVSFEAWKWGPVNRDLYRIHRREMEARTGMFSGNIMGVKGNNKKIIDAVIQNYGALSGMQMGDLTHRPDTPWSISRLSAGISDPQLPAAIDIQDDLIRGHFREILGRA